MYWTDIIIPLSPYPQQNDWLSYEATQSKIQVKVPLSASVDDVSSAEREVNPLAVVVEAVVTVVVNKSAVQTNYINN